jgi:hypothetical protein
LSHPHCTSFCLTKNCISSSRSPPQIVRIRFHTRGYTAMRLPSRHEQAVRQDIMQPPSRGASSGGAGGTVEFPHADTASLCQMAGDQTPPLYWDGGSRPSPCRIAASFDSMKSNMTGVLAGFVRASIAWCVSVTTTSPQSTPADLRRSSYSMPPRQRKSRVTTRFHDEAPTVHPIHRGGWARAVRLRRPVPMEVDSRVFGGARHLTHLVGHALVDPRLAFQVTGDPQRVLVPDVQRNHQRQVAELQREFFFLQPAKRGHPEVLVPARVDLRSI